jgi:hypothetical protein
LNGVTFSIGEQGSEKMQRKYWAIQLATMVLLISFTARAEEADELNLDEAIDAVVANSSLNYFGRYYRNQPLTGYGTGGYGDPRFANFSLNVCGAGEVDGPNCSSNPDGGNTNWRFIRGIGWRKFSDFDAARKDWWDYKKTIGWPFNEYAKRGWNWW